MNQLLEQSSRVTMDDLKAALADRDVAIISLRKQLEAVMQVNTELAAELKLETNRHSQSEFMAQVETN